MSEYYMLLLSCEDDRLQKDIEYHILAIVKGINYCHKRNKNLQRGAY